jgi:hypothetical protein
VREVVSFLEAQARPTVSDFAVVEEDVRFGLPQELVEIARRAGTPLDAGWVAPA